jgi:hypothetical protein
VRVGVLVIPGMQIFAVRYRANEKPGGIEHPEAMIVAFLDRPWRRESPEVVHHILRWSGTPRMALPLG